jgi:hypothetical protein
LLIKERVLLLNGLITLSGDAHVCMLLTLWVSINVFWVRFGLGCHTPDYFTLSNARHFTHQWDMVLATHWRMDPAWSGRGGGGALQARVTSCVGHVCRPPINLLHDCKVLLDYCIWIVIVVHSSLIIMLLLKLLYLILSLIIFCFIMKNSTPLQPLWPGLGGATPPPPRTPPVNPSLATH